jgi:hypothetical protein
MNLVALNNCVFKAVSIGVPCATTTIAWLQVTGSVSIAQFRASLRHRSSLVVHIRSVPM